jgi:uncharacterized heparinase superfamily protein
MPGLLTYWHTLRHLKPIQFYGQLRLRVARARTDARPAPNLRLPSGSKWVRPAERRPSMIGPHRFRFLNEEHDLADHQWDDPALGKLWRYNLHYFDDLSAQNSGLRTEWHHALMRRWVSENPPVAGSGWEPYPTSLRIVNWVKWAMAGNTLPPECTHSLAVQARWLTTRLEIHLLANHIFSNAKALVFAGLFFEGPESDSWLETGLTILEREVPEQILPDGGQFERSPMYHALALEDMLDLCNVAAAFSGAIPPRRQPLVADWRAQIAPMRDWLAAMCHPDGEVSAFNDSAAGIAPTRQTLESYAARLGFPGRPAPAHGLTLLEASGYIRVELNESVALLDVAPIGPDYLPGHAHADTLSFELSLFGERVLVNSGTECYGTGVARLQQRGTRAHNTVVLDGQDSSEVWSGFRVARRARPVGLVVSTSGEIQVRCAHDGYRRLRGKPVHTRQWTLGEGEIVVRDHVTGGVGRAEARFHLHPSVTIDERSLNTEAGDSVELSLRQGQRVRITVHGGVLRPEAAMWHPEFGRSEPTACLAVAFTGAELRTHIAWGGEENKP